MKLKWRRKLLSGTKKSPSLFLQTLTTTCRRDVRWMKSKGTFGSRCTSAQRTGLVRADRKTGQESPGEAETYRHRERYRKREGTSPKLQLPSLSQSSQPAVTNTPRTWCLVNNRNSFLTMMGSGGPRSRCQRTGCLRRALSQFTESCLLYFSIFFIDGFERERGKHRFGAPLIYAFTS